MRRGLGASTGLIALLALVAHTLTQSGGEVHPATTLSASQGGGSKADSKQADADTPPDGPWLATRAFFGKDPDPVSTSGDGKVVAEALAALATPSPSAASRPAGSRTTPFPKKEQIDHAGDLTPLRRLLGNDTKTGSPVAACDDDKAYSMVATVADPVHTRLALFFDGQIDAIERGAEERGWIFAQQWLPWSDPFDGSEHDINVRRKQRKLESEQEALPGILIFRKDLDVPERRSGQDSPSSCLFVLLAPETPTAGVAQRSLMAALTIASVLSPHKIGLLAPSFSGTFPSLGQVVSRWGANGENNGRLYTTAYGGGVSSYSDAKAFTDIGNVRQAGVNNFFSGIVDGYAFLGAFGKVSDKYGIDRALTAYLAEEESGYGNEMAASRLAYNRNFYRFPRDISHLRNAYQEASASATVHTQNPIPSIQLSLNDPNRGEDSIPVFSDKDTPVVQNAGLGVIAEDMNRRGIRLVYIAATNALDELFLVQFLRQQCPNIRVVIGGDTDLLFLPAATQRSIEGTLFLSTYPMFFEGDQALASTPNFDRYSLLSGDQQGLFNVTQLLLWHLEGSDKLKPPSELRAYASMKPDGNGAPYPGLWLLDLTRFGLSPVDWIQANTASDWMEPSPNPIGDIPGEFLPPLVSAGWYVTARLTAIGIIALCVILLQLKHTNRIVWPVWAVTGAKDAVRFPFFAGACVFLSCVPWIIGLPAAFELSRTTWWQDVTIVLLAAAFVSPIALLLRVAHLRPCHKRENSNWYEQPWIVCAGPFYLLILIVWWSSCYGTDSGAELFRWRALHLYSSSSPTLPLCLICIAVIIGFMTEFYRRSDTGDTGPHLALDTPSGIEAFAACYHQVNQLIAGTFQWTRMVSCALVTGISVMLLWQQLPAFEMRRYNVCLEMLVFALIWALVSLAHDATLLWFNLHRILGMVESIPLRGFIEHAARALPRRQVWAFWKSTPQQALGVRMCEALHNRALVPATVADPMCMVEAAETESTKKESAKEFLRRFRRRFVSEPEMSVAEIYHARVEYEALAAQTAEKLYRNTLWKRWKDSELSELTGRRKEDDDKKDEQHYSCDFVALQCCNYLTYVVRRTQRIVWNISFLLVLLIVVLNSYEAQGPVSIGRYIAALSIAAACVVFYVFAGMERNWVLSAISRTTPGELNLEFWLHLAALGILPLLAIIVHLFPEVATFLYSWVAPGVESAK